MRIRIWSLLCTVALGAVFAGTTAVANAAPDAAGLTTPPMGWNSWNSGIALSERNVESVIDAMVASGMRDAGYRYVNLDAGWAAPERDAQGRIRADPTEFPHGIAAVARYAHERGMLLGLYSSPYNQTCGQTPGNASLGHETLDARTFAAWGVDYLKYDWCSADTDHATQVRVFTAMRDALRATGRHIVYSINPNSSADVQAGVDYDWSSIADLTRLTGDLIPLWHNPLAPQMLPGGISTRSFAGVTDEAAADAAARGRTRPGHWNDPDMLVVGISASEFLGAHLNMTPGFALRGVLSPDQLAALSDQLQLPQPVIDQLHDQPTGLSATEQRTHFALWAMLAAPLLAGNDVRSMSADSRAILTNRDIIAVDQDPRVTQAVPLPGDHRILVKPLADGSVAVAMINGGDAPITLTTSATAAGLRPVPRYQVRNLWTHTTATSTGALGATVGPHDTAIFRVTPAAS